MPLEYVEKQVMNVTREQIGAWLLSDWGLPEVVVEAVRHHNNLSYDGIASHEAKLIYIVNRELRRQGLADGPIEDVADSLLQQLGLSRADVDEVVASVASNTGDLDALVHTIMHAH